MFSCAASPAVRLFSAFSHTHHQLSGMKALRLAATAVLSVALILLTGVRLEAQAAHFGAVVTLGSGFSTPTGVAVDAYGNVFVADNGNSAVKEIMAVNGRIPASPVINTLGSGFANPFTVAVDGSGNVFLTDYGHHQVKEIEAVNGSIPPSPTIRILGSGFGFLFGSAVDGRGDVFVTDYGKNEVKELVAVNGVIPASPKILVLGGGFNIPAGVALDASGNIFVGDQNNNAAKEILASSGYTKTITLAGGFNTPDGIAVDQYGNVFVANDGGNTVNEILAVNGSIPAAPTVLTLGSGFLQPFDVAVDASGNVYVADRGNNAVKEIQRAGGNFGQVNVGTTTLSPITLSFTFDTAGTLGSTSVVTLGNSGFDFYDSGGGTCIANTSYNAGDICTVNVKFGPVAPGTRYGAVELLSTSGTLLASGPVQGIGVGPQAIFATTTSGNSLPASVFPVGSSLSGPSAVAIDAAENVFVADSNNDAVKEVMASGGWTTVKILGSGFTYPSSVALDGGGNVYVADTYNDAVKEIVAAGGYTTVNTLGSGFSNPYGVAVDGSGNVYVADFANDAVKEIVAVDGSIPASPNIITLASGLNGPDGVAVDGNGNVFVAIYGDGTVLEIVAVNGSIPASPTIKTIGSGFSGPASLSVDGIGDIFVSDTGNDEVKEIVAAGGYTTVKTLGTGFSFPEGVAVSGRGYVLVADTGNNAVDLLDYVDQPSLSFATTNVGSQSSDSPQTVTLTNDGNAALTFPIPVSGNNPGIASGFTLGGATTCPQVHASSSTAGTVAGGTSCKYAVNFVPTASGTNAGFLQLTDNNLNVSSSTQSIQLSGTGVATPPALTSPANHSTLPGSSATFKWGPGTETVQRYQVFISDVAPGHGDLYNSGTTLATQVTLTSIPTIAGTVYLRFYYEVNSVWSYTDYSFTEAGTPVAPSVTSPANHSTLPGATVTFKWSPGGDTVQRYQIFISDVAPGHGDLYNSGTTLATQVTLNNIPTTGGTVYLRFYYEVNGVWSYTDYSYTEQ